MRTARGLYDLLEHVQNGDAWAIVVLGVMVFAAIGIVALTARGLFLRRDETAEPMPKKRLRWPEDAPENKPWKTKKPGTS